MVKRSKKYREAAERVDRNNLYTANEAIALLKSMPSYNFDQTVEAVFRLSVDPRKADQLVRVPSTCLTALVRPPRSSCSPVARRLPRLPRLAPTSSVMTT